MRGRLVEAFSVERVEPLMTELVEVIETHWAAKGDDKDAGKGK